MLTHLDPARLAATTAVVAAAVALAIWAVSSTGDPEESPPTRSATVDARTDFPEQSVLSATTPAPTGPTEVLGSRDASSGPSPTAPLTPPPDVMEPEPEVAGEAGGRAEPATPVEQLALNRLIADATGRGRDRWPDLTAPPCCDDLTITGIATTGLHDPPAPQTIVITWTATDRSDGRVLDGVTTTEWHQVEGRWAPQAGVATGDATGVAAAYATDRAADGATRSPKRTGRRVNSLLSGGLVASKAADNRHTPLIHPSECRSPRSWRGV